MALNRFTYKWNTTPRIITYNNPKKLKENIELAGLLKDSVQLCASDTLMQGLIAKYGRGSFGVLTSIENFQNLLFEYSLTGAKQSLQVYLDIKKCINGMNESIDTKSQNFKNAFSQNAQSVMEAFKLLSLSDYQYSDNTDVLNDEQQVFFNQIYSVLIDKYRDKYQNLIDNVNETLIKKTCEKAICKEIEFFLREDQNEKINNLVIAKQKLNNLNKPNFSEKRYRTALLELIDSFGKEKINTIVIHGVVRFTPEIMMLIKALDKCGIHIVFLINYCSNLKDIYGLWERAYEWVGVSFECVKEIDISEGRAPGRVIAEILNGHRVHSHNCAKYRKYDSLTEFTDLEIRHNFLRAQEEDPRHPLSKMKVQYFSVDSVKPNDILRNYFPEQFMEKPFMAYPVGQFIKGLFEMWNFESGEIVPDFSCFKDCAQIKIAHSSNDLFSVLNKIEVYFKDIDNLADLKLRATELLQKVEKPRLYKPEDYYLSFYDIEAKNIGEFLKFVDELNIIAKKIFGSDALKEVDYQVKFRELIDEISERIFEKDVQNSKENELLQILKESLAIDSPEPVVGSIQSLKEAVLFFLSVKQEKAEARWIVRGFDQLDGAPLMNNRNVLSYEIAGLSMKNMTRTVKDVLPWPLTDTLFNKQNIRNLYSQQVSQTLRDRNDYLKFYLFYISFFGDKDLVFSYIENEGEEKQRPYYLLGMMGLVPYDLSENDNKEAFNIKEAHFQRTFNAITNREKDIFSICPYKYFISSILDNKVSYSSDYHIRYFLEIELTREVSKASNYDKRNLNHVLETYMKEFQRKYPFFDDAEKSDIRKYVIKNFLSRPENDTYIDRKRDFLIAQWKENEVNYMHYNKTVGDIHEYLVSNRVMPSRDEHPHKKICQECCFSNVCLNYYYNKEVDV